MIPIRSDRIHFDYRYCDMKQLQLILLFLLCATQAFSQGIPRKDSDLQSGPMVGYSEMREVMLWIQTKQSAKVQVAYKDLESKEEFKTAIVETEASNGFTAHLSADQVEPGRKYSGEVFINGLKVNLGYPFEFQSQSLWQYRTDPPTVKFIAGSCAFTNETEFDRPGTPYGGGYEIWKAIGKEKADFMVWLGDNMYLREADWSTWRGILHRYTYARSLEELQPILAQMHHYAIWDDHDFGPNDSDRSFIHKEKTLKAFKLFWANNGYGLPGQSGITGQFTWADCDFFMMDNRYYRSPDRRSTGDRTQFGSVQLEWLIDALKSSRAPFKFVCTGGMVLSTFERYENMVNVHPEERQALLDAIQKEKIPGVIFLTGDRHHTELSYWKPEGGVGVYDFTISPLTSGAHETDEANEHIVKGTNVGERNYAVIEVSGKFGERVLRMSIQNRKGKELWSREVAQGE